MYRLITKFLLAESLYKYKFERQLPIHNEYPKLRITISKMFKFQIHKLEILPGGKKNSEKSISKNPFWYYDHSHVL